MGEAAWYMRINNRFFLRRMTALDIDAVVAIEKASFLTPWSRASFEAEMTNTELNYYVVLVDEEKNKQVVGYAGMWIIVDEAHVTNVALLPDYRGQSLGKELMMGLMAKAKDRGTDKMTLEVRISNDIGRRLYTSLGFVESGIRPGYYTDTGEDAIIMWCDNLK